MELVRWDSDSASLVLAPERARVLQVNVGGLDAFWTDPDAETWNVGGDRLWLGPEAAWFWTGPVTADFRNHEVPAAFDPGSWTWTTGERTVTCTTSGTLEDRRTGHRLTFDAERTITVVPPPLPGSLAYDAQAHVRVVDGPAVPVTLWSLIQVPGGGRLHVACRRGETRDYFEPAPATHVRFDAGVLTLDLDAAARWKVGLGPGDALGRMAWERPVAGGRLVVARAFDVDPAATYGDSPLDAPPGGNGDACQAFNGTPALGSSAEMEHHSPAVPASGDRTATDRCRTVVGVVSDDAWPSFRDDWLGGHA